MPTTKSVAGPKASRANRMLGRRAVLAAVAMSALTQSVQAQTATWTFNGSGTWGVGANWFGGVPAQGNANGALFNTLDLKSDAIITLDGNQTVGTVTFNDTFASGHGWVINPGSPAGSL